MSAEHAIEIPASALSALRVYAAYRTQRAGRLNEVDELCRGTGPLSAAERQTLQDALTWWRVQIAAADQRVRQISARLG